MRVVVSVKGVKGDNEAEANTTPPVAFEDIPLNILHPHTSLAMSYPNTPYTSSDDGSDPEYDHISSYAQAHLSLLVTLTPEAGPVLHTSVIESESSLTWSVLLSGNDTLEHSDIADPSY